mgnify:FL=1
MEMTEETVSEKLQLLHNVTIWTAVMMKRLGPMRYAKKEIAIAKSKTYLDFVWTFVVRMMPWILEMGYHLA